MAYDDETDALAEAIDAEHGPAPRKKRGVSVEWAERIEAGQAALGAKLDRLLAHFGLDAGQTPTTVTHDPERGLFSPGSGWIPDEPPPEHFEPLTDAEMVKASLAEARAALRPPPRRDIDT